MDEQKQESNQETNLTSLKTYMVYTNDEINKYISKRYFNSYFRIKLHEKLCNYAPFDFINYVLRKEPNQNIKNLVDWFNDNLPFAHDNILIELVVHKDNEEFTPMNVRMQITMQQIRGIKLYNIDILAMSMSTMITEMMHCLMK